MPKCATGWGALLLLLTAAVACAPVGSVNFQSDPSREEGPTALAGGCAQGAPAAVSAGAAGAGGTRSLTPSKVEAVGLAALPTGNTVPPPMAAMDTGERSAFAPRCETDKRGNWVCVWPVGPSGAGGPCAFGADGAISVASQVWETEGQTVTAQLVQLDSNGQTVWSRAWRRAGELPALTLRINALAFDAQGLLHAGGEDSNRDAPGPLAEPGYYGSLLDARWFVLDARGTVLSDRTFGSGNGLERISDLGVAPDGMYIAGSYHSPWVLGGERLGSEPALQNHFLAQVDREGKIRWWRSFGSDAHDGNDLRLASAPNGDVAITGHPDLTGAPPGYVARFDARGSERWTQVDAGTYISRVAYAADDRVFVVPDLIQFDAMGAKAKWPATNAADMRRIRATERSSMVLATDNLHLITELDLEGRALRSHAIDGALSAWYSGGLCVDRERVAVSSTIEKDSDFGILDQTIEIRERSAFVLVLKQW